MPSLTSTTAILWQLLTPHYVSNILLLASFYVSKILPPVCFYLYAKQGGCQIELREYEILLFLALVVMMKNRKATSWQHYLSTLFTFGKLGNLFLYYRADPRYAVVFGLLALLQTILLPAPRFDDSETIVYFRGPYLADELERDRRVTWLIAFYASWSPACVHLQPVFAELSKQYGLDNLKFGKLDVSKYPKEAARFRINADATSRQLPSICLFRDGKEVSRRPLVDKGRCIPYVFSRDHIVADFDLNNVFQHCKQNPIKSSSAKLTKTE